MFIAMICFKDVRPGDVVCRTIGEQFEISEISSSGFGSRLGVFGFTDDGGIQLYIKGVTGLSLGGRPNQLIGLLYRPYSVTRTKQEIRQNILLLARTVDGVAQLGEEEFSSHLGHLRHLLEEYELGKSPEGDCQIGRCAHGKTAAGMCGILALTNPPARDC